MAQNQVLESTKFLTENPWHVFIDEDRINTLAKEWAQEDFIIPDWKFIFNSDDKNEVIDFFTLGNSLNFAFTDFHTGEKYTVNTGGKRPAIGSAGMWAALKRAYDNSIPILDGNYLKNVSEDDVKKLFAGENEIPMLAERHLILREVGDVLSQNYDGHFHNLISASDGKLFYKGKGLVERLTRDFPSFNDSASYQGLTARFDKRAQLATGMLAGRFGEDLFDEGEVEKLTVFADYQVPKTLRALGVLKYGEMLSDTVDNGNMLSAGNLAELEIRASTLHASNMLQEGINQYKDDSINALHMDFKLWSVGRKTPGKHHLCRTTNY